MAVGALIEPTRPVGDGGDQPLDAAAAPLMEALRDAYVRRVEAYHREYAQALGGLPPDQVDVPVSAFKEVPLRDDDGTVEPVLLDDDLFASLLDVYLTDGWPPIGRIVGYARDQAEREGAAGSPAGGTPVRVWRVAYDYLLFVRNLLAILIRDALMDIEYRAAVAIDRQLSDSAQRLADAVRDFGLEPVKGGGYAFGNKVFLNAVASALGDVVDQRVRCDKIVASLRRTGAALATIRERQAHSDVAAQPDGPSAAGGGPAGGSSDPATDLDAQSALLSVVRELYQKAYASLATNAPLALLIVDGLTPPVKVADVEKALGPALGSMHEKVDDLFRAIDPDRSLVAAVLPGLPGPPARPGASPPVPAATAAREVAVPIDPRDIQDLAVPDEGPEAAVIRYAMSQLDRDRSLFPLVHEQTWRLLAGRGEIPPDSFTYVVHHHYQLALADWFIAADRGQETVATFFHVLGVLASIASVALLFTPAAELFPSLSDATAVADALLLAYQASVAVSPLRDFDRALDARLVAPDAVGIRGLAEVGGLMVARAEYAREMTTTLLKELLMMVLLPQWPLTKQAMIMRGFLMDLETIVGTDGAESGN